MCGITGMVDLKNYVRGDRDTFTDMTNALSTGGTAEVWFSTFVGLGYKGLENDRLFQKKSNGNMYSISFIGSLSNEKDRINTFLQKGHTFHSSTEAEVALTAYIEWKEKCMDGLEGDFTFGIWDEAMQQLYLTCNQLVPLYYYQDSHLFLFGTEKKPLMEYHTIDDQSIRELPKGHSLLFSNEFTRLWKN
jgi:asparagine synthase (glutamine-hydrolysing)